MRKTESSVRQYRECHLESSSGPPAQLQEDAPVAWICGADCHPYAVSREEERLYYAFTLRVGLVAAAILVLLLCVI
ncbi:hypothetical protein PTE30175_01730 [Pandoraea terrae]|uniref:Uncharacterized protein n=1 Tax=Pandoraea terrae TaxID=1537710 RepID=A0A5E4U6K1_9BURK|nr:hypothetical protein PTE30175_01730 [Pandoraea terrae]